jgi:hypothetical protein
LQKTGGPLDHYRFDSDGFETEWGQRAEAIPAARIAAIFLYFCPDRGVCLRLEWGFVASGAAAATPVNSRLDRFHSRKGG